MLKGRVSGRPHQRGFTLVELLVAMSIMAVALAVAMPSMSTFLQNSKLASAARSYYAGIQQARTEAIRTNSQVQFVLTDSALASGIEGSATLSATGKSWLVRAPTGPTTYRLVEARAAAEGAMRSGGAASVEVNGAATGSSAAFDGSITFDGFGAVVGGNSYDLDVSNPSAGSCAADSGPMRCQRIRVTPGGQLQLCDPAVASTDVGDSRRCL